MTDLLLAVVIIIFGVLGFFLMKRIDRFLESSRKGEIAGIFRTLFEDRCFKSLCD